MFQSKKMERSTSRQQYNYDIPPIIDWQSTELFVYYLPFFVKGVLVDPDSAHAAGLVNVLCPTDLPHTDSAIIDPYFERLFSADEYRNWQRDKAKAAVSDRASFIVELDSPANVEQRKNALPAH